MLWGVPKGSYASNANGPCRIVEFRKMVQVDLLLSNDPTLLCILMFMLNRPSTSLFRLNRPSTYIVQFLGPTLRLNWYTGT